MRQKLEKIVFEEPSKKQELEELHKVLLKYGLMNFSNTQSGPILQFRYSEGRGRSRNFISQLNKDLRSLGVYAYEVSDRVETQETGGQKANERKFSRVRKFKDIPRGVDICNRDGPSRELLLTYREIHSQLDSVYSILELNDALCLNGSYDHLRRSSGERFSTRKVKSINEQIGDYGLQVRLMPGRTEVQVMPSMRRTKNFLGQEILALYKGNYASNKEMSAQKH